MAQPLSTLAPGRRFHVAALPAIRAEVVRVGEGSVEVRALATREKHFTVNGGDPHRAKSVRFTSKPKVTVMSRGTLVEPED
jgi:hypothetical protein